MLLKYYVWQEDVVKAVWLKQSPRYCINVLGCCWDGRREDDLQHWGELAVPQTAQHIPVESLFTASSNIAPFPTPFSAPGWMLFYLDLAESLSQIVQCFWKQPTTETNQQKQKASRQLQLCFVCTSCLQGRTPAPSSVTADKWRWEVCHYHQCRRAGGALSLAPHWLSLNSPSEGPKCIQPCLKQLLEVHNGQICYYSPVDFIVVIVNFPPEVKPDQSQEEGWGEDQEPEALPLRTGREITLILLHRHVSHLF